METLGKIKKEVSEVKFTVIRMKNTNDGFLVGKTCLTKASLILKIGHVKLPNPKYRHQKSKEIQNIMLTSFGSVSKRVTYMKSIRGRGNVTKEKKKAF